MLVHKVNVRRALADYVAYLRHAENLRNAFSTNIGHLRRHAAIGVFGSEFVALIGWPHQGQILVEK